MSRTELSLRKWCEQHPAPLRPLGAALRELAETGLLQPPLLPLPGGGATMERFEVLAAIAEHDVALARLAEGHADAVAILEEAQHKLPEGAPETGVALGVWAAGPPSDVVATPEPSGGFRLEGTRRWCSGAGTLSHALVTAELAGEPASAGAALFLVSLSGPSVQVDKTSWPAVGMARTDTFDVTFDDLPLGEDAMVGPPGWYLGRPGFWHGAAGVASCWWGGARGVAALLSSRLSSGDPYSKAAHGYASAHLWAMQCALERCASSFDGDPTDSAGRGRRESELTRLVVENGATEVLRLVGETTGASPLCRDPGHAQRVADLTVYLRQHHGPRDAALLSDELQEGGWPK